MAERRMFAKTIIDSDAFLEMPQSSQNLYFHLSMRADDEGFINNPSSIMRTTGSKSDDMSLLIAKKFIIPFDSGIVVIKHWRIHNYIQSDRFKETKYKAEKEQLTLDENGAYRLPKLGEEYQCIQNVYKVDTQDRLGKDRLGKDRLGKVNKYIVEKAIAYLNIQTSHRYKANPANTKHLIARLNEGYTLQDVMQVIRQMTGTWENDPLMVKYLCPDTLFGNKFDKYLNTYFDGVTSIETIEVKLYQTNHIHNMTGPWDPSPEVEEVEPIEKEDK